MKIMRFKYVLLLFISLFMFTGCSVENGVNKIVITSDDYMKFNTSKITVKSEKLVKLTLKHIGKLDVQVMGHNFVLLKDNVDILEFANKAAMASKNQYIPVESDEVIVYTDMIGGGQETTIEFLPPDVGVYNFICSFPGHYAMMKGKFIVE